MGIDADSVYLDLTITLSPGDRIVFYTDGISEAVNPTGEMFGVSRIDAALSEASDLDAATIRDRLLSRLGEFTAGTPALDDQTLVVASAV
jgi:sigma-B regulation protein RsbU (phosphoserine phosphatase)